MNLKVIDTEFSVCKVEDYSQVDLNEEFVFTGHTDEELSLVCPTTLVPDNTTERNDGWKASESKGHLISPLSEYSPESLACSRITLSVSLPSRRSTPTIY